MPDARLERTRRAYEGGTITLPANTFALGRPIRITVKDRMVQWNVIEAEEHTDDHLRTEGGE